MSWSVFRKVFLCLLASTSFPIANAQVAVTTFHEDSVRTGQNVQEAILTPANVSAPGSFGKLCSYTFPNTNVNHHAYAQPLYLPNISINGQLRNVVYIATERDEVFAYDADCNTSTPLWQKNLGTPVTSFDYATFLSSTIGVTGTPVIDLASKTLYVVAKVQDAGGNPVEQLHALDITNGAEKFGAPVQITASVAGTGTGSSGGTLRFDPRTANQRAGLLLVNGVV